MNTNGPSGRSGPCQVGVVRELADFMLDFLKKDQSRQHDRRTATEKVTNENRKTINANLKQIEELDDVSVPASRCQDIESHSAPGASEKPCKLHTFHAL